MTTHSTSWKDGTVTEYAEYSPDGKYDGRHFCHHVGETTYYYGSPRSNIHTNYSLYERGEKKNSAILYPASDYAKGRCTYNGEDCAPHDPRVRALIAQVAPVVVRPAAPDRHPPLPTTRPQAIVRWIGRLVLPPQELARTVARKVHPPPHAVAGGRATQHNRRNAKHDHAVTRSRAGLT
jgi:hypothetical protein